MPRIGDVLRKLRHNFIGAANEQGTEPDTDVFDRAVNETLIGLVDGAESEAPAQPKKTRKPRGPSKKKADAGSEPHGDQFST